MKHVLALSLAGLSLLAPASTRASLIVYSGVEKETIVGQQFERRINARVILVVDPETSHSVRLSYTTINGAKRYATRQTTNTHTVVVNGFGTNTFTAIAYVPTECQAQDSPGQEGVYLQGANKPLNLGRDPHGPRVFFPKTLVDSGNGLSYSQGSNIPTLSTGSFALGFDRKATIASNESNETLEDALRRLTTWVEGLGYVR